jgi:hypothetical protein
MKKAIVLIVLMLSFSDCQAAREGTGARIVLPNPKLLRCALSDCSALWLENSSDSNAVFPKQIIIDMNQNCVYGFRVRHEKSVPFDDVKATIDERYGKWAVAGLEGMWRVNSEKFVIQLVVANKKDEKMGFAEAGEKEVIYVAIGGASACKVQ